MINPISQFKIAFELWVASVFGVYSKDFYEWNKCYLIDPKYTQENLLSIFWQNINEGWDFMQPDMIAFLERERQWELDNPPPE